MTSPCARIFVFFKSGPQAARSILFLGRGRRGTDWKGAATRARAKERAEWAKATRRPWRTAAGRHTETHDRRAHHHESSNHRFFLDVLRGSSTYLLFTSSLFFVVLAELYTLHGERPPAIRRDVVLIAAPCQTVREDEGIVDICVVVFGSIALFSLHVRGSSL